jgi:hypothetical protein
VEAVAGDRSEGHHWQPDPKGFLGGEATGVLDEHVGLRQGPLAASMPVMDAVLPIASIGLGIGLFGEHVSTTLFGLTGATVGIALLVTGSIMLDTSPLLRRQQREERKQRSGSSAS